MSMNLVAAEKDCYVDLTVVAIGGGGDLSSYGGSGSGYVETAIVRMSVNSPEGELNVGQRGESSKVEIAGELVLEALPGETGAGGPGGAGYSGGGAYCNSCSGGTGGSGGLGGGNSTYNPGGKGSGFDLNVVDLKNFILTPGAGGQRYGSYGGGGGGGVAVNGKMPDVTSQFAGAGFGGGSAGSRYPGYQGCVILEI